MLLETYAADRVTANHNRNGDFHFVMDSSQARRFGGFFCSLPQPNIRLSRTSIREYIEGMVTPGRAPDGDGFHPCLFQEVFRNTKLERCAKKCEARGGRLPPKGAAHPCEAAEAGGQTTAGGGMGRQQDAREKKGKSSQKSAKKRKGERGKADGGGNGGGVDGGDSGGGGGDGGGDGGSGGGRRLSKSSTRTCPAAWSSSLTRRRPLLPGQVAAPPRHSSDAADTSPPLWIEFLEVLLVRSLVVSCSVLRPNHVARVCKS